MIILRYKVYKDVWWKGHLLIVQYSFEKWTGATTSCSFFHQNDANIESKDWTWRIYCVETTYLMQIWFLKMLFEESKHDTCDNIYCCVVKLLNEKLFFSQKCMKEAENLWW